MAIVRNKKPAEVEAAVAAFGAAADLRPEETPAAASVSGSAKRATPTPSAVDDGPKSSLIRWAGNEDLRDAIIEYHQRERYPIHTVLLEALRRGFEQMDSK